MEFNFKMERIADDAIWEMEREDGFRMIEGG